MMNHAYILDFGIQILDLRYSACLMKGFIRLTFRFGKE